MHPREAQGRESLDRAVIGRAVSQVRAAVPGVPIGVSTGAWIEPDHRRRATTVGQWEGPDMASVNLSEPGASAVMQALFGRGIGVEAGTSSVEDVYALADTGFQDRLLRALVEIADPVEHPDAEARKIDEALDHIGITVPRLHHGEGRATWPVLRQGKLLGRDIRIGSASRCSSKRASTAYGVHEMTRSAGRLAGGAVRFETNPDRRAKWARRRSKPLASFGSSANRSSLWCSSPRRPVQQRMRLA
jgi:hypothetical protein